MKNRVYSLVFLSALILTAVLALKMPALEAFSQTRLLANLPQPNLNQLFKLPQ